MAVYDDVVNATGLGRFYTNLKAIGLPLNDWASGKSYKVGLVVVNSGRLYRCTTAHTSESTFDATKFEVISPDETLGVPILEWTVSTAYAADDLIFYNNAIYKCTTAHTSDASDFTNDASNWVRINGDTVTIADNTDIDGLFS